VEERKRERERKRKRERSGVKSRERAINQEEQRIRAVP